MRKKERLVVLTGAKPSNAFRVLDALLLLMALIWGSNYSIVKSAFLSVDPQAFNAMRMSLASVAFLAVMGAVRVVGGRGGADREAPPGEIASIFHTPMAPRRFSPASL